MRLLVLPKRGVMSTSHPRSAGSSAPRHAGPAPGRKALPTPRRLGSRATALTLLAVCLSGCTSWREYVANGFKVGPNYCRPAAAVADQWIESNDPSVSTAPPRDEAWWRVFRDPVLDSLIEAAYQENLTLRVAGLRILEVRAQRNLVAGELFPQSQEAFGDYARFGLSGRTATVPPVRFFDEWATGASLAWELDFWGQFRRAIEAADAELDASVENYDDVLVLLLAEVAQSYVDLRTAEQRLDYARKNVDIQQQSLKLADVRFRNGATTRLDVTQAQSNLSQTQSFIPPLEAARRQAANQLCILLGMPPRDIDALLGRRPIPSVPAQVAVGIPADLLRRRPDVRRAEREVAAQSARIGVATAELYPHFSIAGTIYFDAANFSNLFEGRAVAGNVGPSFRWNILHYGRLVNGIRIEEARFQQLAVTYQNTVLQANAEAENALIAFLKSRQQVKFLAESTDASQQSLGLVQVQYNEGQTDFNRVLTVEQVLTQQEDQLAVAQGAAAGSLVQLYKALGGGWQIRLGPAEMPPGAAPEPVAPPAGPPGPVPQEAAPPEVLPVPPGQEMQRP
jgi:NodT family efflux transporter outer membrane factor (OMF) lipoprotein